MSNRAGYQFMVEYFYKSVLFSKGQTMVGAYDNGLVIGCLNDTARMYYLGIH